MNSLDDLLFLRNELLQNNIEEQSLRYVETIPSDYMECIDPLIAPLCALLISKGFFTLHSCSNHIRIVVQKTMEGDKRLNRSTHTFGWYIMYIATQGTHQLDEMKRIKFIINESLGIDMISFYAIKLYNHDEEMSLNTEISPVQIGKIQIAHDDMKHFNDEKLFNLNKDIFNIFKKELTATYNNTEFWKETYIKQGFPNKYFDFN